MITLHSLTLSPKSWWVDASVKKTLKLLTFHEWVDRPKDQCVGNTVTDCNVNAWKQIAMSNSQHSHQPCRRGTPWGSGISWLSYDQDTNISFSDCVVYTSIIMNTDIKTLSFSWNMSHIQEYGVVQLQLSWTDSTWAEWIMYFSYW